MHAPIDFGALFEAAPNAYMVLDRELRYVAANATYVRLTGTRREDLIGRRLFDLFPHDPADPENAPARQLRRSLERVLSTGKADHLAYIPYRVPREGGGPPEERAWSATHVPLLDASGAVSHVLQHTVDVSGLRAADPPASSEGDALRSTAGVLDRARAVQEENTTLDEEREHLRSLFEQAPGFMCVLEGPQHVFVLTNAAYQRLVGDDRPLIGAPVATALPEVAAQGFVDVLDRVYRSGERFVGQGVRVMLQRARGAAEEEVFLDFVYQPVRGRDGVTRGIFVQGHDVTERLKAERENLESRRVAEAFSAELLAQSRAVEAALHEAGRRIRELEEQLASR